jgi:hypothetical protein
MLDVPRDLIWFVSGLLAARHRYRVRGQARTGCLINEYRLVA